jgi:hypothetical protein
VSRILIFSVGFVLLVTLTSDVQAATILLVSNSTPTNDHDESFITFLEDLGYTVDTNGMVGA